MQLSSVLTFSHELINRVVNPGDTVVDATVGNGHDTAYLAGLVGSHGHVIGFDIQQTALKTTRQRLVANQLNEQVSLHHQGHEKIAQVIPVTTKISCAIFNLGYLPGGDKKIVTKPTTTLQAISALEERLTSGGTIILVIYRGHPGASDEEAAVLQHATNLDQHQFQVLEYKYINQVHLPPYIVAIQKR